MKRSDLKKPHVLRGPEIAGCCARAICYMLVFASACDAIRAAVLYTAENPVYPKIVSIVILVLYCLGRAATYMLEEQGWRAMESDILYELLPEDEDEEEKDDTHSS